VPGREAADQVRSRVREMVYQDDFEVSARGLAPADLDGRDACGDETMAG